MSVGGIAIVLVSQPIGVLRSMHCLERPTDGSKAVARSATTIQEESGGADFFCAQARGRKGGRSGAAAEDRRGGSISSDETHRWRKLLPTASSARSKKAGAGPP